MLPEPAPRKNVKYSRSKLPAVSRSKAADGRSKQRTALPVVLLTGFEPFGDNPGDLDLNPSAEIAKKLDRTCGKSYQIKSILLPCEYAASVRKLRAALKKFSPAAVICLGQAGGRSAISLERIAINWDEAALADNSGQIRRGSPIRKTAPAAYFSTLPIHAMQRDLLQAGIAAELSSSAGQFVCNHVFFELMHVLHTTKCPITAGFVHLPYLPEQAQATAISAMPSMPLEQMLRGIQILIESIDFY